MATVVCRDLIEHSFVVDIPLPVVPMQHHCRSHVCLSATEAQRAQRAFVDPAEVKFDQPGLMRDRYYPGDLGFDPLGLKPTDSEELNIMITKELQHGRLAMIAASGFLAQEAVDGKGILEHFSS